MATLAARASTRSLSSTSSGTAQGPCCVLGMSPAPTTGGRCRTPSWPATGGRECAGTSGPMPPSPSRRCLRVPGGAARPLRYQAPQQRGAAMGDRPSVEEAGGKAAEEAHHLVRRLLVSSGELGPTASGDSQGRMAPGRAIPSSGLHRHQQVGWPRGGSALLQWQRYCRAGD